MRLNADELGRRLQATGGDTLPNLILINGDEPLMIEEALDECRSILKSLGFDERIKHQLEAGFDWGLVTGSGQSMSLFGSRKIIELRVPKSLGAPGTKALSDFCSMPPSDDILLVIMPALDFRQRKAKWCKLVENTAWLVDCLPVTTEQFPRWLKMRLQSRSLRVETGVIELLSEQLEGNLLAAAQEVDKLKVLADNGGVTLKLVTDSLADQAKFDVYTLTDAALSGDFVRALRIKQRLQSEGVEPVIVVWSLVRELRTLAALSAQLSQGQNRAALFKQYRIWSKRESLVSAALARHSTDGLYVLLEQAANLDQSVKGQRHSDVGSLWHQIEALCAGLCGITVFTADSSKLVSA